MSDKNTHFGTIHDSIHGNKEHSRVGCLVRESKTRPVRGDISIFVLQYLCGLDIKIQFCTPSVQQMIYSLLHYYFTVNMKMFSLL